MLGRDSAAPSPTPKPPWGPAPPPKDDATFLQSVEPLRGAIRLHCYRMLGSVPDGDIAVVQETWLRAWRARIR